MCIQLILVLFSNGLDFVKNNADFFRKESERNLGQYIFEYFVTFKILSPKRRNMGSRQALYEWVGSITTCGPPYKVDKEVFSRQFPTYVLCIRTKKKQRTVADFFARKSSRHINSRSTSRNCEIKRLKYIN